MKSKANWFLGKDDLGAYMKRFLIRTPWFNFRFHKILQSDEGRDFHDHPWNFQSLILRGGYMEHRPGCFCQMDPRFVMDLRPKHLQCRYYGPGSIVRRQATDLHRLELLDGKHAWTLVLAGPYKREWGFQTQKGWIGYREYHRSFYK